MKPNIITAKTMFYFGILPIVGGLFLFFNGHWFLGILIWILGLCVHTVAGKYYNNGPAVDFVIAVMFAVFGIFGIVHNFNFWQTTLGLITATGLVIGITTSWRV